MATIHTDKFKPKFSNALNIDSIISAPLVAASKGNATMLKGQIKFLLDFCFNEIGDGLYEPVMIKMNLKRMVPNAENPIIIEEIIVTFEVPLLVMIPITTLAVTSLSLDFNIDIINHSERSVEENEDSVGGPQRKTRLIGKVSQDHARSSSVKYEESKEKKFGLNVSLEAESIDLPVGVTSLIELYSKSIFPIGFEE